MVDVFETIDVPLAIVYKDRWRTPSMSLRRKTVPPTQKHPRSSSSGRKELIAKEKTEKQSVRKRTVLDNRFHRTVLDNRFHRTRVENMERASRAKDEFLAILSHELRTPMTATLDPATLAAEIKRLAR